MWPIPDGGYVDDGFFLVSGNGYDPGENAWATMDLTGDAKPDLVVTSEATVQFGSPGVRYWRVFAAIP